MKFNYVKNKSSKQKIFITNNFKNGILDIALIYKPNHFNSIEKYPSISYTENSKQRIQHAVKEKRKQVKNIDGPVILAIEGSNSGTELEDFDHILFGYTYEKWDKNRKVIEEGFKSDGLLISENKNPTYQGILAFTGFGFRYLETPTLYLHQNANPILKDVFDTFYIRYYNKSKNCIDKIEPQSNINYANFKFITV